MGLRALLVDYWGVVTDFGADGNATEAPLVSALQVARANGIRVALVSNVDSSGIADGLGDGLFDAVVVSGEIGVAKPAAEIYLAAARQVGVAVDECVFVDDSRRNVLGAVQVGMVGVRHVDPDTTLDELAILFGFSLRGNGKPESG